jgi:hypothetical protein
MRCGYLLLALLALTPSGGLASEMTLSGRGDAILLSLRISEAKKDTRRVACYKSLARQRRTRRARGRRPRDTHAADKAKRLTCDRPPSKRR